MRPDRIAVWGLTALALGLVGAALWLVGGPAAGRMEARDQARFADLLALTSLVACKATTEGDTLPADLSESPACFYDARRTDPYTGAPYRYEVVGAEEYRLCAEFEAPDRLSRGAGSFDAATGCLYQQIDLD